MTPLVAVMGHNGGVVRFRRQAIGEDTNGIGSGRQDVQRRNRPTGARGIGNVDNGIISAHFLGITFDLGQLSLERLQPVGGGP